MSAECGNVEVVWNLTSSCNGVVRMEARLNLVGSFFYLECPTGKNKSVD